MQNEKCSNKTLRVCGAGGVRKNKGKWQAVVTVADEMTGKKVQRTRNTGVPCLKQSTRGKAAAMRVLAEFRSEVELELASAEEARAAVGTGLPAEQRDDYAALPLSEALEKFIDFCLEMNRITPTTRDDYHYSALHIERDDLGLVPVNEVTTDDVNAWSRRRIALGTAPDTLNKSFKLGKRLYAVLLKRSNDTIGRNPFDGALAPRVIARPRNALRSDLVPKLNSVTSMMSDSTFRRAVVLALHTGMRIGGLATLMWTVPGGAQETGGPYMRDPRHPRHFTDEFKRQIVDLYNAGKPKREIMDEYDLGKSTVERWIKSINATGSPRAACNRTPEQNRILELERENRRLRMEVDVLKQAALIYARK